LRFTNCRWKNSARSPDRRRQLAKAQDFNGRGNEIVTYIVDATSITQCLQCLLQVLRVLRVEKDDNAYVITFDELDKKIEETIGCGGTQMLMQGGHHPKLTKQWYLRSVSHVKNKFPGFNIHGFRPERVIHFRGRGSTNRWKPSSKDS